MTTIWPWMTLIALGAYHGVNPGMGWLFAVAKGLQERSRKAVIASFAPIALGHAASIAAVVALVAVLQFVVSPVLLRYCGAAALVGYGLYKLLAPMSHPRWVGMRVSFRDLTLWSFLMATAHGAGLMLVPLLLSSPTEPSPAGGAPGTSIVAAASGPETNGATTTPECHVPSAGSAKGQPTDPTKAAPSSDTAMPACHTATARLPGPVAQVAAVVLHTLAMLAVMAFVAVIVYEKIGLAILRRAWFNLDVLWAGALMAAGVLTLLV